MKFSAAAALPLLVLAACGPVGNQAKKPEPTSAVPGDAEPQVDASLLVDAPLTEAECEALFDHTFELIFTAQQATRPVEERPSEADMQQAKDALRGELLAECVGASRTDFPYECSMAADELAAMKLCVGGE